MTLIFLFVISISASVSPTNSEIRSPVLNRIYSLIVSAKMLVVRHKFKESPFLLSCDCFSCHAVIHDNSSKLKFKRIFAYQIIINRHLKCRSNDTSNRVNGAVTPSVFLQLYQPALRVRQFNLVNSLFTKFFFLDNIEDKVIICFCVVPYPCFL